MKFFFPDSQDLVDPSFDFDLETRASDRVRHRHDQYAHEVFSTPAFDGLLVSKGIVDGFGSNGSRYTTAQRHRLLRVGAKEFFRTTGLDLPIIGDCGAFTYVREEEPPYSVDEVLEFYVECRFDFGISVDHVILAYQPKFDELPSLDAAIPRELIDRQQVTLELASEFITKRQSLKLQFHPIGVAQGWSPGSYARAVNELQKMGYDYIALGGMVPLKSREILECLARINETRSPRTRLHLLGVTRTDHVSAFAGYGVASFDSTSPLRQAFKDDRDNYYTLDRTYTAIRIPQIQANPSLQRMISSGVVSQDRARQLEKACLDLMRRYSTDDCPMEEVLDALVAYEMFFGSKRTHRETYREVLIDRPWTKCPCDICRELGYHVILFRGAERNRRRGFHNVWVFYRRLRRELGLAIDDMENVDVHDRGRPMSFVLNA